jgi:Polysaccharide pyruvyl transferase
MIPTTPMLHATPETIEAVSGTRAVVILIGGYDGSGNYGDLAQLDAALAVLAPLEPALLPLSVLERSRLDDYRAGRDHFVHPPRHAVFFDPGEGHDDGLLPLPAPARLAFSACYLYGGGYLNPSWGERKLAMLDTAEALLAESGTPPSCRLSSGLQVDPEWIGEPAQAERLRSFELLGARDPRSVEALASLGSGARVVDTADDAIGALRRLDPAMATPTRERVLRLNCHVAEHPWVTERPAAMAEFHAGLAAELGRHTGMRVQAQPLIAYADRQVNDRGALDRLAVACAAQGVEMAEPRLLKPAGLAAALAEMRAGALTVSCSYHVALTSLLLGVPAALLRDNAYYEQKAAGLAEAFGLPAGFALDSGMDPGAAAPALAAAALDEPAAALLRGELLLRASKMRERRAEIEAELLARLGGAAAAALAGSLDEVSEQLRARSAEPARLQIELAQLREQAGTPVVEEQPAAPAEESRAQATLDELTGSRSWRMTAPLRRAGALLRRR